MDSDSVNNVSDTIESTQVAEVAKEVYYDLISQFEWLHVRQFSQLESLGDTTFPTTLKIPSNIYKIEDVRYDVTKTADVNTKFKKLIHLSNEEFISITDQNNSSETNVSSVRVKSDNTMNILVRNDLEPTYWTSFDNEFITLDSYNNAEETTVVGTKTKTMAFVTPTWSVTNTFTPDLEERWFPTLLAEVKRVSHLYYKQQPSVVDEVKSRRGMAIMRQEVRRTDDTNRKARFGRRSS